MLTNGDCGIKNILGTNFVLRAYEDKENDGHGISGEAAPEAARSTSTRSSGLLQPLTIFDVNKTFFHIALLAGLGIKAVL
jgi:hypothetical protein